MAQLDGKQIKDLSLATAKLQANAVTAAKVASDVLIASGANALTGDLSAGTHKITNLGAPSAASDAARLADVNAAQQGFTVKAAVRLVATTALPANTFAAGAPDTLTANANGALTIDGVAVALNDAVLVAGEGTGSHNGIYTQTQLGTGGAPYIFSRRNDYDTTAKIHEGDLALVEEGTANAGAQFAQTAAAPVLNTTALVYARTVAGTSFAIPTAPVDAAAATAGSATTAMRSDAKPQVSTAAPTVTVKSEATAAATGTATTVLRTDMQIQALTAAPADLGAALAQGAASGLARADHVHRGPKPTTSNKNMTASVTVADGDQATATTVTTAPVLGGYVGARVNGLHVLVGDGTKVAVDAFFSNDGGATARAMSAIAAGDTFRWNGSVAGYQLAAADRIDLDLETF